MSGRHRACHAYGLNIDKRPPCIVERHQTASWGWRWSCARCGKSDTRIAVEQDAHKEASGHACDRIDAGRENAVLGLAPHLTTVSKWQWDERRRHAHY